MVALVVGANSTETPIGVAPAGWTYLGETALVDSGQIGVWSRLAQTGDTTTQTATGAAYTWAFNINEYNAVAIIEVGNTAGVDVAAFSASTSTAPQPTLADSTSEYGIYGFTCNNSSTLTAAGTGTSVLTAIYPSYHPFVVVGGPIPTGSTPPAVTATGADQYDIPIATVAMLPAAATGAVTTSVKQSAAGTFAGGNGSSTATFPTATTAGNVLVVLTGSLSHGTAPYGVSGGGVNLDRISYGNRHDWRQYPRCLLRHRHVSFDHPGHVHI
jgi:hypothetical protein